MSNVLAHCNRVLLRRTAAIHSRSLLHHSAGIGVYVPAAPHCNSQLWQLAAPAPHYVRVSAHAHSGANGKGMSSTVTSDDAALEYTTVAQPARTEVEVKKSRFVVTVWPVTSGKQALQLIKGASDPGASHNCWAYRVGAEYRSSDDGEPGGTAGRPILSAIEGEELEGVAVLVTRYFGGVKLGAGGLVRAYGGAARDCLRAAPKATVRARKTLMMRVPFEVLGAVYNIIDKFQCERLGEEYGEDEAGGQEVQLTISVDAGVVTGLVTAVSDASAGKVVPQVAAAEGDEQGEGGEKA